MLTKELELATLTALQTLTDKGAAMYANPTDADMVNEFGYALANAIRVFARVREQVAA